MIKDWIGQCAGNGAREVFQAVDASNAEPLRDTPPVNLTDYLRRLAALKTNHLARIRCREERSITELVGQKWSAKNNCKHGTTDCSKENRNDATKSFPLLH